MYFQTLEQMMIEAAVTVRPPERLTVSEAAAKYRYLHNPGSYIGYWDNDIAPYLVEPMDVLTSSSHSAMIFAGPAQCGKTDMLPNWITHTVVCDPADMMVIEKSQTTARDFSKRRIDRLHRHSKAVGERLIQRRNADNTFDKIYKSGMMVTLSWPTINELSGKPIPRLWLTDYDRMDQDVDGEGSPFDLARKRATTFDRFGMTVAESSPGFPVENPKWIAGSKHEAPPTKGILALYNRGDRRRWYWRCPHCRLAFEPTFQLLRWPNAADIHEAAEMVTMECPHCSIDILPEEKAELNIRGRWLKDGQSWAPDGRVIGIGPRSDIASFWLMGVCAAFATWKTLVVKYLEASREYEQTGSEEALKTTTNTDQGVPYVIKGMEVGRLPEDIKAAAKPLAMREVPVGVRFIVATIDVQKNRFVVQVMGYGVGGDTWVIDRYEIRKSERRDEDGERLWVSPGSYAEDWQLIVDQVMEKTYPLADGSGRQMLVKMTYCDSGGREGVTTNAYDFVRWLREERPELASRFQLVKGDPLPTAPRVRIVYPDSERKDRHAGARGEIPVLMINSTMIKDQMDKLLGRKDPGGGLITFPDWLPDTFYTELTVEIRTAKGWENPKRFRNESWDLLCYGLAGCLSRDIRIETIDWSEPPEWADEWDVNSLVYDPGIVSKVFKPETTDDDVDLAALAEALA